MSELARPAIELNAVTKRFKTTIAVDNLSLQVQPGQVLGLLGPNGAGKSTMIKMLMGLVVPDEGLVRVLDMPVMSNPLWVRQHVGYVPEQHFIYAWMRVNQVISFCRPFYERWNDAYCDELVKRFRLDPSRRVRELSKGMVTKLALVLAMAHEPEVLILDEPMAGLDAIVREELVEGVLRDFSQGNRTLLLSSHTFSDVHRLADVIAIMHEGRLLVEKPTVELVGSTKRLRAVLRDGQQPSHRPAGLVYEQMQGREWLLTLRDAAPGDLERVRASNPVEHIELIDLGLEEIFKDYIRGSGATPREVGT